MTSPTEKHLLAKKIPSYINFGHIQEKFHVDKNGCWIWDGVLSRGYPKITINYERYYVHRIAFKIFNGHLMKHLEIDHLCRVTRCINPSHLEQVSKYVNNMRSNSLTAIYARRKKCPKGHEYTRYTPKGYRYCVKCRDERNAIWRAKMRTAIRRKGGER